MANNFRISNAAAIRMADAFDDEVNVGSTASTIRILTGTQPTDPDTAESGTLLAVLTASDPMFGSASDAAPGALLTASAITDDTSANTAGTAGYFRIAATGIGADDVADGEVGTSGADLNFNTVNFTKGSTVSITSFKVTMPES